MIFSLPVRRFLQNTERTETPKNRFGSVQWILTRPTYRFKRFDLAQVPPKNRAQALKLELAQWTPFANSDYYIGWHGQYALVWCWDADKVQRAILAQKLKPQKVNILPESVLQTPVVKGLCLSRCHEGFEGQLWRESQMEHSRWWPQLPSPDEWMTFQRDTGIPPHEQQYQPPDPRVSPLLTKPWASKSDSAANEERKIERLVIALGVVFFTLATCWYGFSLLKLQRGVAQLNQQQIQLQHAVEPINQARSQSLDYLVRINALHAIDVYPKQLTLMGQVAQALPADKSFIKDWDFQAGQLKMTLTSSADIATASTIDALQKTNAFINIKALPGRDPKIVTFQMDVIR